LPGQADITGPNGPERLPEAFLKTPEAKKINAIYAHNDDMAIGAIQAMKQAGLKPGKDIKIVSIDAIKDALEALVAGELNCSVECSPRIGPQLFDIIESIQAARTIAAVETKRNIIKAGVVKALKAGIFEKRVPVKEGLFDQSVTREIVDRRAY